MKILLLGGQANVSADGMFSVFSSKEHYSECLRMEPYV